MNLPLEIHHLNVSQGDSTLIINRDLSKLKQKISQKVKALPPNPDEYLPFAINNNVDLEDTVNYAVLIDGGADQYGWAVMNYVQKVGVKGDATRENFYTVATHFHSDHVDGLRHIFWEKADYKNKIFNERYPPKIAYDCGDDPALDPDTGTYKNYTSELVILAGRGRTTRKAMNFDTVIDMGEFEGIPINIKCVATNGYYKDNSGNIQSIIDRKKTADQNARSVSLVLEMGEFRYFLGGDIGGSGQEDGGNFDSKKDVRKKMHFSSHPDIETTLRDILKRNYKADPVRVNTSDGHMCCFKANHHGSSSSNDTYFLETMQPKVVVTSCGIKEQFHGHATQEFFNRVDNTNSAQYSPKWSVPPKAASQVDNTVDAYYITEIAQNGKYSWGGQKNNNFQRTFPKGKILGNIIVRPYFEDIKAVEDGIENEISIQVYGTGEMSEPYPGDKPLRSKDPTTKGSYLVGPWIHVCGKH